MDERGILSTQHPTVFIQTLLFILMWVWQVSSKGAARLHCVNQFVLTGWILVYLMTFSLNWEHHCTLEGFHQPHMLCSMKWSSPSDHVG
jgi:hypothetical protein